MIESLYELRPRTLSVAYRGIAMLGSVADAEGAVHSRVESLVELA